MYSELVKYEVIGFSGEDREMPAIRIGAEDANEKIYFQCQIHARMIMPLERLLDLCCAVW